MKLEPIWYEISPVVYLLAGTVAALAETGPLLLRLSGALLAVTALTILGMRTVWRRYAPDGFDDFASRRPRSESFFKRFEEHW